MVVGGAGGATVGCGALFDEKMLHGFCSVAQKLVAGFVSGWTTVSAAAVSPTAAGLEPAAAVGGDAVPASQGVDAAGCGSSVAAGGAAGGAAGAAAVWSGAADSGAVCRAGHSGGELASAGAAGGSR
jgi:hypothetical protein